MTYQRVRYFLKAAEKGSFSKAAEEMFVSSQGLTKQIGLLEEEVGGKLFDRSAKGVELTELGVIAYEKWQEADELFSSVMEELRCRAGIQKERIRIGIFNGFPAETVTPIINYLMTSFPQYQISLEMIEGNWGKRWLLDGGIDAFITYIHEEDNWENHQLYSFDSMEGKVIVSKNHPWASRDNVTVEDMQKENFLKINIYKRNYKVPLEESFFENVPCKEVINVNDFGALYAMLQIGKAFAISPVNFVNMENVKAFEMPGRKLLFHVALICNVKEAKMGVKAVVNKLKEEFHLKKM